MNIHFVSLGCDKNAVDSEVMLGLLLEEGHHIAPGEEEADAIVVNTCGFIADATDESIRTILDMSQYKKEGRCKALIVTGCMVQRYREEIARELPEVDAIVGVGDYDGIVQVLWEVENRQGLVERVTDKNRSPSEQTQLKRVLSTLPHFAYLKIAEGCDNHCTYCTIPSIRGRYRSRTRESLLEEAGMLARRGVRELILVAQDTGRYGEDLYGEPVLDQLIRSLSELEGIMWIRLLYVYPERITERLIEEMAGNPKVCHYIDMPIQHGSDAVLKAMGRKSTRKGIEDVVRRLRERMPDVAIRTTLIAGFPGETEEDFDTLMAFVEENKFDKLGVFPYSQEEGTPAARLPGQNSEDVKISRVERLMERQREVSHDIGRQLVGRTMSVIVDGRKTSEDDSVHLSPAFLPVHDVYIGRSQRDCYGIDGVVSFTSQEEIISGSMVKVKITGSDDYDLQGTLLGEAYA